MKKNLHPPYDFVVFQDISTGAQFRTRSTMKSDKTVTWDDGKSYPLVMVETSSSSHPFYTGKARVTSSQGRIHKFMKRYGKKNAS